MSLLAAFLLANAGQAESPASGPDQQAVMEAVFEDMIRDVPGLGGPYDGLVFCLEGPEKTDPPRATMERLAATDVDVRPGSACHIRRDDGIFVTAVESATGTSAVMLRIMSMECADENHCSVYCGYFAQTLSSSGNAYDVAQRHGEWVVTDREMRWIS